MIKTYLKQSIEIVKRGNFKKLGGYYNMEEFVYRNGRLFKIKPHNIKRGPMKECYRNAALLSIQDPKYYYVEGYAMGIIPAMHAWCIDKDKNVIDPTWPDGREYFGVVFKESYLFKHMEKYKRYGLIDNWQNEWPLFKLNKSIWLENKI